MKFNWNTIFYTKDEILKYLYKALENIENNTENINVLLKDAFVLFHSWIWNKSWVAKTTIHWVWQVEYEWYI